MRSGAGPGLAGSGDAQSSPPKNSGDKGACCSSTPKPCEVNSGVRAKFWASGRIFRELCAKFWGVAPKSAVVAPRSKPDPHRPELGRFKGKPPSIPVECGPIVSEIPTEFGPGSTNTCLGGFGRNVGWNFAEAGQAGQLHVDRKRSDQLGRTKPNSLLRPGKQAAGQARPSVARVPPSSARDSAKSRATSTKPCACLARCRPNLASPSTERWPGFGHTRRASPQVSPHWARLGGEVGPSHLRILPKVTHGMGKQLFPFFR